MTDQKRGDLAIASNVVLFALAGVATVCVVYKSWHYGFFFTPFPAFLSGVAVLFMGAAVVGGSHLIGIHSICCGASAKNCPGSENVMRFVALALPLPLMAYACLGAFVEHCHAGNPVEVNASHIYVQSERFLFGVKRADDLLAQLSTSYRVQNNYELAEHYAKLVVVNASHLPLICLDPSSIHERLIDRLEQLDRTYLVEGKKESAKAVNEILVRERARRF